MIKTWLALAAGMAVSSISLAHDLLRSAGAKQDMAWSSFSAPYATQISRFFGNAIVDEFWDHAAFDRQILRGLSMVDRTSPIYPGKGDLGSGLLIVTGCRQHSCADKVALVLDSSKAIIAAATITQKCLSVQCQAVCRLHPVLSIYWRGSAPRREIDELLMAWAYLKLPSISTVRRRDLSE